MADDIFDELIEWWCEKHKFKKPQNYSEIVLTAALKELAIIEHAEKLISKQVNIDWIQDSEQTYMTLGEVNVESDSRTRTVLIAAYAVITPPMLDLEEQAQSWVKTMEKLKNAGVIIPKWYLNWKATIFTYYPPYNFLEYISEYRNIDLDISELAESLFSTLFGLANLSIEPLDLTYSLRTDTFIVYYCGLGFDVGGNSGRSKNLLLEDFEGQLMDRLPKDFYDEYLRYKNINT